MVTSENAPSGSLVGLLADLVAFPTESRTSNLELIDLYADRAATAGAVVTVVQGEALLESGRMRSLDALHLTAALELGDDLEGVVTYDGGLGEAMAMIGYPVVAPI
jgi:hypothetical protein